MKYPQLTNEKWLREQLQEKKLSARETAKIVGCSYGGILYYARKFQIEIPEKKSGPKPGTNMKQISTEAYRRKYPNGRFGAMASHWKGGRRNLGKHRAYIGIYMPDHPNCTSEGYVMEHRLVMEKKIGRFLELGEIIHHVNGIKHDNRIENLELMDGRGEHSRTHFKATGEVSRLRQLLIDNGINPDPIVDKQQPPTA